MDTPIIQNGHLTVPLFHGTSTAFYDSILSKGLGRNIVEEMGIRKAATILLDACESCPQDDKWPSPIDACQKIAADPAEVLLGGGMGRMSFRCGGTYLSASSETAAVYAFLPSGGEALREVLRLYRLVSSARPEFATHRQFTPLVEFASRASRPLLVEASQVPVADLRSEQGDLIDEIIERMQEAAGDPDIYDCLVAQHKFELMRHIPAHRLRFHLISQIEEFDGEGGSRTAIQRATFEPE
jgi:hypothetical protein